MEENLLEVHGWDGEKTIKRASCCSSA